MERILDLKKFKIKWFWIQNP